MFMNKKVLAAMLLLAALNLFPGCGGDPLPGQDVLTDIGVADTAIDTSVDTGMTDAVDVAVPDVDDTATPDAVFDTGPIAYWTTTESFALSGGIYDQLSAVFSRISGYTTHIKGAQPPDPSFLGASGIGNGYVFGLIGYGAPTNSLHTFTGPGYDIDDGFFGDYSIYLVLDGSATNPVFDDEWVTRSMLAPVVITRGTLGALQMDTVDFVPWTNPAAAEGSADDYLRHCAIRHITVKNTSNQASQSVQIRVRAFGSAVTSPSDGVMVESRETRMSVTRFTTGNAVVAGKNLLMEVGVLAAGAESTFVLTHCAFATGEIVPLPEFDVAQLLEDTADRYAEWESTLVDVVTPDPMVNDFIDGMKMTLKLQTAETGATCPMSEYTRTWARDNMGPVVGMLSLGGFADVEGYLDYVYYAILKEGDLKNSYPATLEVDWDSVTVPDWASMPPLGDGAVGKKRVAAETPSYMVLMYGLHNRFTGLTDRIVERQGLLHRCLFDQGFGTDNMLSFTGDETYRAAMNAAFGIELEYPHEDKNWSGNSNALWLGAGRDYARFAAVAGLDTEAAAALTRFDEVEQSTIAAYTRPDKCFAAYVVQEDMAQSAPFEDASLQVTWSGWKDGDDQYAQDAFACLYDSIKTEPGEVCSPLDAQYGGVFRNAWKGTYTGMLPGYTLHSMTEVGHPDASAAFNMVRKSLSSSGDLQEYMILDDHSGLTLLYDKTGVAGDYTAKYRPWEGGIVVDAVMQYLFGFEPDANTKTLKLRPHLPNNWPLMSATGLRGADDRFDVDVVRVPTGYEVRVVSRAENAWKLSFRWDGDEGAAYEVNGTPVDTGATRTGTNFATAWAVLPDIDVVAGASVNIKITTAK
jgi:hypothetical protein